MTDHKQLQKAFVAAFLALGLTVLISTSLYSEPVPNVAGSAFDTGEMPQYGILQRDPGLVIGGARPLPEPVRCGDGRCHSTESTWACPQDCNVCGDDNCYGPDGENYSCPEDCAICGDGRCDWTENGTCMEDCCADNDGDGYYASYCGGTDCDDDAWYINPGRLENCWSDNDENCNPSDDDCDCTDSDGGFNLNMTGNVTWYNGTYQYARDYCRGNTTVAEYYCTEFGPRNSNEECWSYCFDGGCRS